MLCSERSTIIGHALYKGCKCVLFTVPDDKDEGSNCIKLSLNNNPSTIILASAGGSYRENKIKIEGDEFFSEIDWFNGSPVPYCAGNSPLSHLDCRNKYTCLKNKRFRDRKNFEGTEVAALLHNDLSSRCSFFEPDEDIHNE